MTLRRQYEARRFATVAVITLAFVTGGPGASLAADSGVLGFELAWSVRLPILDTLPLQSPPSGTVFALPDGAGKSTLGLAGNWQTFHLLDGSSGDEIGGFPVGINPVEFVTPVPSDGARNRPGLVLSNRYEIQFFDLSFRSVAWTWEAPNSLSGPVALVKIPTSSLVALSVNGSLFALNTSDGRLVWSIESYGWGYQETPQVVAVGEASIVASRPALYDNRFEPLADPELRRLDLATREILWRVPTHYSDGAIPVRVATQVGDVLVVLEPWTTTYSVPIQHAFAVSVATGASIWNASWEDWPVADPLSAVAVQTRLGPMVIATTGDGELLRIDARSGDWSKFLTGCPGIAGRPVPLDWDDDGYPELVVTTTSGAVCILRTPDLSTIALRIADGREYRTGLVITDIDGDDQLEVFAFSTSGHVDAYELPRVRTEASLPFSLVIVFAVGVAAASIFVAWNRRKRALRPAETPARETVRGT